MRKHLVMAVFAVAALGMSISSCSTSDSKDSHSSSEMKEVNNVDRPQYVIKATQGDKDLGDIVIELYPDVAPKHVANFDSLVSVGFYDGLAFHRVIPDFMIQGGDPNSKDKPKETWGTGAPGQTRVPAEFSDMPHKRGTISAARTQDPNSATSQFFICVGEPSWLDGQYSVYGGVVSGMDVVDAIVSTPRDARDNPLETVRFTVTKSDD